MPYRTTPSTLAQRHDAELVLINLESNRVFVANDTGARLWDLLVGGEHDLESAMRLLGPESEEAGWSDEARAFVAALLEEKLLRVT